MRKMKEDTGRLFNLKIMNNTKLLKPL